MKSAKVCIAIILAVIMAVAFAIPAFAATASTSVTVLSGTNGTPTPFVKAMWESTGSTTTGTPPVTTYIPNAESGDPSHASFVDPKLTQVYPNAGFQATTPITFWAVVTDSSTVGNLTNVYADVSYPASPAAADPGPNGQLKFEVQLTQIDPNGPNSQAMTDFNLAYLAHMTEINTLTPSFNWPTPSDAATQWGDIMEELSQGTARLYYANFNFDNCELWGDYPVMITAYNQQNNKGLLGDTLQWQAMTSAAFDFTAVNYGSAVVVGVETPATPGGDVAWNTSMSGAMPASILNTGNTYLQLTVSQDDMGFGTTSSGGVTSPNVTYDARLGAGTETYYNPNTPTLLPQILHLCAIDKIDFSIKVTKDPSATHTYSGTMTLTPTYSAGPATTGNEYGYTGNPAITPVALPMHTP
jgi:hypothetical protein